MKQMLFHVSILCVSGKFHRLQTEWSNWVCRWRLFVPCLFFSFRGTWDLLAVLVPKDHRYTCCVVLYMLQLFNTLDMFRDCEPSLSFDQGPPGSEGQMGPPGLRGTQVGTVQGETVNGDFWYVGVLLRALCCQWSAGGESRCVYLNRDIQEWSVPLDLKENMYVSLFNLSRAALKDL